MEESSTGCTVSHNWCILPKEAAVCKKRFWSRTVIQEENRLPDTEKRTRDVKGSSKSKRFLKSSAKGLVYGVLENVSDKMYHPPHADQAQVQRCFSRVWVGSKKDGKGRAGQRNTNEDSRAWILDALIRCADILVYLFVKVNYSDVNVLF